MKRLMSLMIAGTWAAGVILLGGCSLVENVMDMVMEPEDIVVDYAVHVSEIMNNTKDCDALAAELKSYCDRRNEKVSEAIKKTIERFNSKEIDENKLKELKQDLAPIKNTNFTSCLLTPSVTEEKLNCIKPILSVLEM